MTNPRFADGFGYLIREFERDVRKGNEADEKAMDYIKKHGVGYALEWAASHVVESMHGRVASATFLPRLEKVDGLESLETVLAQLDQLTRAETGYISLGNTQMLVTSKLAMIQSLARGCDRIRAFVNHMNEEK